MIDHARALLDRVDARRDQIDDLVGQLVAEGERLEVMRASLAAFIEQPGQESAEAPVGSPAPVSQPPARGERRPAAGRRAGRDSARTPAPAASPARGAGARIACPECDEPIRPMGIGPHRRKSKRHAAALEARAREVATSEGRRRGGQKHAEFERGAQEATYRQRQAGLTCDDCTPPRTFGSPQGLGNHRARLHPTDDRGPRPVEAPRQHAVESWVCGRCPEAFGTRALRDAHQATHPPLVDHGGPVGTNPQGRRHVAGVQIA